MSGVEPNADGREEHGRNGGNEGNDEGDESDERRRMRRAVEAVRREGQKAALIVATVDAVLAVLATVLLLRVVVVDAVPTEAPLPGAPGTTVHGAMYAGVAAGALVFAADLARQLRDPLVERFERANPAVAEALRTARDAVEDDADSRMARRLYEDVLTRLRETSSIGLIDLRHLGVVVALIVALSVANVGVVVADLQVTLGGDGGADAGGPDRPSGYGGLEDPDSVLGESSDVGTDGNELNASIPTSGDGENGSATGAPSAYDTGGFTGGASVESQQAGFSEQERLEDADIIREYNLQIRETEDDDQ